MLFTRRRGAPLLPAGRCVVAAPMSPACCRMSRPRPRLTDGAPVSAQLLDRPGVRVRRERSPR